MKPVRKTRHALMFMGAGALAAYFFDPDSGPERRERLMEQIQSMTGGAGSSGSDGAGFAGGATGSADLSSSAADGAADGAPADRSPIDLASGSGGS